MVNIGDKRGVRATLRKSTLAEGQLVLWWPCLCPDDPRIDVNAIPDRSGTRQRTSASFLDVYREAEEQFRKRVRDHEKIEIELPDDDDNDSGGDKMGDEGEIEEEHDSEGSVTTVVREGEAGGDSIWCLP